MRRLSFVVIICTFMGITSIAVNAEDTFPVFKMSSMRLYIPINKIQGGQDDIEHEVGFNFSYNVNAQLFTDSFQGHIQTLAQGFSGKTDRTTPWKTLTELLAAYQKRDIDTIKSLYTSDSQSEIDELIADPKVKQRFIEFMTSIAGMTIQLGFDYKNGVLAIVGIDYGNNVTQIDIMPFYFVRINSQYLLSAITLEESIDSNIALYLQQGYSVADLPAPKHGLTIEKTGTGSGAVKGTGIDCGEDCIEVYVEGTSVWLKATPDQYSTFEGWQENGAPLTGRLVMKADTTVTALFTKIPPKTYTLTVQKSENGTVADGAEACAAPDCIEFVSYYAGAEDAPAAASGIDCGDTCNATYLEGTTVYLKATPAEGAEFVGWQLDDNQSAAGTVNVSKSMKVTAIFKAIVPPAEPTVTPTPEATIEPTPTVTAEETPVEQPTSEPTPKP